jgi:hypothetical protein
MKTEAEWRAEKEFKLFHLGIEITGQIKGFPDQAN